MWRFFSPPLLVRSPSIATGNPRHHFFRLDLFTARFFRLASAALARAPPPIAYSSFSCPCFMRSTSHNGVAPRPAQVSPFGPRYLGGTFLPASACLRRPGGRPRFFPDRNAADLGLVRTDRPKLLFQSHGLLAGAALPNASRSSSKASTPIFVKLFAGIFSPLDLTPERIQPARRLAIK